MEISTLQSSKKKLIDKENRNNLWTELPKSPWNIELVCRCKHPLIVTSHMPYSWLQIYTRDIFTDVLGKGLKVSIKAQHPIWSHSYFQLVKLATGVQMVGKSPSFRCPLGDWSDHACSVSQACPALCDPMTVARQAPLSMGLSWQEYWSGLPFPPPGDPPDPET